MSHGFSDLPNLSKTLFPPSLVLSASLQDGDRFWRMPECFVRGNTIKYLRIPDEVREHHMYMYMFKHFSLSLFLPPAALPTVVTTSDQYRKKLCTFVKNSVHVRASHVQHVHVMLSHVKCSTVKVRTVHGSNNTWSFFFAQIICS